MSPKLTAMVDQGERMLLDLTAAPGSRGVLREILERLLLHPEEAGEMGPDTTRVVTSFAIYGFAKIVRLLEPELEGE